MKYTKWYPTYGRVNSALCHPSSVPPQLPVTPLCITPICATPALELPAHSGGTQEGQSSVGPRSRGGFRLSTLWGSRAEDQHWADDPSLDTELLNLSLC